MNSLLPVTSQHPPPTPLSTTAMSSIFRPLLLVNLKEKSKQIEALEYGKEK